MCKNCGCESECECGGDCQCTCHDRHFERRYQTKAEQIAAMEAYLSELKTEVQAVEEHLVDLRK